MTGGLGFNYPFISPELQRKFHALAEENRTLRARRDELRDQLERRGRRVELPRVYRGRISKAHTALKDEAVGEQERAQARVLYKQYDDAVSAALSLGSTNALYREQIALLEEANTR